MTQVGWINGADVLCLRCGEPELELTTTKVRLHLENLLPYRQRCHACHAEMSRGASLAWPELFEGRPLTQKQHGRLVWDVMLFLEAANGEADHAEVFRAMRKLTPSGDGPFRPTASQIERAIMDVTNGRADDILVALAEVAS